jgi:hypothetical protein
MEPLLGDGIDVRLDFLWAGGLLLVGLATFGLVITRYLYMHPGRQENLELEGNLAGSDPPDEGWYVLGPAMMASASKPNGAMAEAEDEDDLGPQEIPGAFPHPYHQREVLLLVADV